MAKPSKTQPRQITRKETARRRRDAERNRRLMIGLIIAGALVVILIAAGVVQELVLKPRQPIATVNGVGISTTDYQKRVLLSWFQANDQITDPEGTSLQVLDDMIDEQIIREQARQRGITVSPEELDEAIEQVFGYQRNTPTPAPTPTPQPSPTPGGSPTPTPVPTATPVSLEAYQKAYQNYMSRLKTAARMSEADFRSLVELDILRRKLYDEVSKEVPATDEQVRARHILIAIREAQPTPTPLPTDQPTPTPDPNATPTPAPRNEAEALALITEIRQKLLAGEDFAKLAQEYSDDPGSKDDGGDLGWFGRGMMVQEFEDAAFALEPGQISEPILTAFGYHLIQVEEKDPARPIDEFTLAQRRYEAFDKWLSDLRAAAKIERRWTLDKVPPTPSARSGG